MSDLDMLKATTDAAAVNAAPGGRWDSADEAVSNVLRVLYENAEGASLWSEVYSAIKSAYVGQADWGDE